MTNLKIMLHMIKAEAEIIRAALAAHRNKLATAINCQRDKEFKQTLTDESRATSQLIGEFDRLIFEVMQ